jgi:hypothetical protein
VGLPVCIVTLLAEVHTLKNDKGMREAKEMVGPFPVMGYVVP